VCLLDSTAKKIGFLADVIEDMALHGVEAVHGRAEELGHDKAYRERYDLVTARALSGLTVLAELCLPLARVGGCVIACKGPDVGEELSLARPMIAKLGGMVQKTVRTHIPSTDVGRTMVVMAKSKPTPVELPRHYSLIASTKPPRA
jgi:16S rRNA (guanine527-N7)-methyltransferase